jgi:hypothetical protein
MKYRIKFADGSYDDYEATSAQEALDKAYDDTGEEGRVVRPQETIMAEGAAEKAQMDKNIQSARSAAIDSESGLDKYLMPYSAQEQIETGDSPVFSMATLKDAFSLPGRMVAPGDPSQTSEQREGTLESIATSPVVGAAGLFAPFAPYIAKAALPKTAPKWALPLAAGGIEGVAAIGAGAAMDDEYGGGDVAFDIATSIGLPVIGQALKIGGRAAAKSMVKKALIAKGKEPTEEMLDRVVDQVIIGSLPGSKAKLGKELLGEAVTETPLSANSLYDLSGESVVPGITDAITGSVRNPAGRNVKQALADIGRVQGMGKEIDYLAKAIPEASPAGYWAEEVFGLINELAGRPRLPDGRIALNDVAQSRLRDILVDYGDIPEVAKVFSDVMSGAVDEKSVKSVIKKIELGEYLKGGGSLKSPGDLNPVFNFALAGAPQALATNPYLTGNLLSAIGQVPRFLPQFSREFTDEE